jgi:hypothetical protein
MEGKSASAVLVLVIRSSSIPDNKWNHSSNVVQAMVGLNTVLLLLLVLVGSFSLFVDKDEGEAVAVMLL